MSSEQLPDEVRRLVDAVNAGDTDAFLSAFADDGYVDDNGRRFTGRDEIRRWSDRELIGARTSMEVTGAEPVAGGTAVDAEVTSTGFNGYSRFTFAIEQGRVQSMVIAA